MQCHKIDLFISHSWKYSNHYQKLFEWIFETTWITKNKIPIKLVNHSVPQDDPIHNANSDQDLKNAIYNRIFRSNVIIIPTGMYANYSKWIQKEIEGAKLYQKPILAVDPWGQQRSSSIVASVADNLVGWRKTSVVEGIYELYNRG